MLSRLQVALLTFSLALLAPMINGTPVSADTVKSAGKQLTVTPAKDLASNGATIRVRGKGFNPNVGIYVALCLTPKKGSLQAPGPCGGGVNVEGSNPASAWISSNPPGYGKSLAIPYKRGGRFDVRITISPMIGDIDCRVASCAVVTRADHTRSFDRQSDVFVPVSFKKAQ